MAASCMMKQSDEKHILGTATVELMEWSPRRDLIVMTSSSGDVTLRRLSWKKVWKISEKKGSSVTALVWRPDCEVLAVGYSSGEIILVNIETGETIHTINLVDHEVSHMTWETYAEHNAEDNRSLFVENFTSCIPNLPPLPSKASQAVTVASKNDLKKLSNQKELNILWVGTADGQLHAFIFGIFPVFSQSLSQIYQGQSFGPVLDIENTGSPSNLLVLAGSGSSKFSLLSVEIPVLGSNTKELYTIAMIYGNVMGLIDYLDVTIKLLQEAWEDALVDLEGKLSSYGKNNPSEISLSADLLELLVFGNASKELENFLVNEVTDKGLKRMGHAMELSYVDMQKLVIEQLNSAGQALSVYANLLNGLSQQVNIYGPLGLDPETTITALNASGSFIAKTLELQQVIGSSMKYLKMFFLWLFAAILRLSNEPVSQELASVSEQDLEFIANFLYDDFDLASAKDSGPRRLKLERVGQYLRDEPLTLIEESKDLPWNLLLEKHPNLSNTLGFFETKPNFSLIQQFTDLKQSVEQSFSEIPARVGISSTQGNQSLPISVSDVRNVKSSMLHVKKSKSSLIGLQERDGFFLLDISQVEGSKNARCAFFKVTSIQSIPNNNHVVVALDFYNPETLSLLLGHPESDGSIFAHISVDLLRDELLPLNTSEVSHSVVRLVDAGLLVDPTGYRQLVGFPASCFALNSYRKVAAILSADKRKVRIFDMEAEEEDEEDNDRDETVERSNNSTSGMSSTSNKP